MRPYIFFALSLFQSALYPFENLSLEEKVGQILMVHFTGETCNSAALDLIENLHVGGIIYYNWANNLTDPLKVKQLSADLQTAAKIPLFIAADQEGGLVTRLENGFTIFPGNRALGETNRLDLAQRSAKIMGQELKKVGVNFNLSPVIDVNSNPRNPVIGIRSFGKDPERVVAFGHSVLKGYEESGMISSLKHFPGHGDVEIDSHEALPILRKSLSELEKMDLAPFIQLGPHAEAIVTAHILVTALDEKECVTLSSKALSYLREKIGFEGLILSDSLVMEGLLTTCPSVEELAVKAFIAGCDLLILGGKQLTSYREYFELTLDDVKRIHAYLVNAVKSGRISEERLNQSVERILSLKEKRLFYPTNTEDESNSSAIAAEIARLALRKTLEHSFFSLSSEHFTIIAPDLLGFPLTKSSFSTLENGRSFLFQGLNPDINTIDAFFAHHENEGIILFFTYNAWKYPQQSYWVQKLIEKGKEVIVICLRDPLDAELFEGAKGVFTTFSPTLPSIEAVYQALLEP